MIRLVWPQRRAMGWGLALGLGVALTYAASLGGILPVLKVVVEQESLRGWLLERAGRTTGGRAVLLQWCAAWFPEGTGPAARWHTLLLLMGALLAANLVGNALRVGSQYLILYATHRAMMNLRRDMYRKALHVPVGMIAGEVSGRVNQFLSDTREIFLGLVTLFGKVAREPLKAVCVLLVALAVDARLTLIFLAIAPPALGVLWYFGRRVRRATVRVLEGYGRMLSGLEETLEGLEVVKGHVRQGHERRRMWRLERQMLRQQLRLAWIEALSSPLIEVAGVLIAAGAIVWLAGRTFAGTMEPSHFVTMMVLLAAMLDPVRKVANVYNMVQRSSAAAARVFEFLDAPEESSRPAARSGCDPAPVAGDGPPELTFEHVTFRYEQRPGHGPDGYVSPAVRRRAALEDVSLRIRAGECVAIVGPNGSGKSTLARLLPRLIEPQRGRVRIDGVDVRELDLRTLRRQIAMVPQRPVLFARTVFENIAYGCPGATLEEVRQAARRAYAAEFIESWPRQYETVLGEHGVTLSGGQRQRIALARAFLKPARILILDEATSEVDVDSERQIHAALLELRRGKTTLLIAHRHTVMEMAERIVVMDAGRIVDVGTHAALLARCPLYAALYRSPVPH